MQSSKQASFLEWSAVAISAVLMLLASGLILYPQVTNETILTALRLSSLTTALPFLLIFSAKPLTVVSNELGKWLQTNHRYLWLTLTLSHLIHLYQIRLFYQLGQSCALSVWLITAPLWIIMVGFSIMELTKPQLSDQLYQATPLQANSVINSDINSEGPLNETPAFIAKRVSPIWRRLHGFGLWYTWLVFTLAFGLGAAAKHLLFYNVPALILFLSGALIHGIARYQKKSLA